MDSLERPETSMVDPDGNQRKVRVKILGQYIYMSHKEHLEYQKKQALVAPAEVEFNELTPAEWEDVLYKAQEEWKRKAVGSKEQFEKAEWEFKGIYKQDSTKMIMYADKSNPEAYHTVLAGGVHKSYFHFENKHDKHKALHKILKGYGIKGRRRKKGGIDYYIPRA